MKECDIFSSALQPLYRESDTSHSVQGVLSNINALFRVSSSSLSLHIKNHPKPIDFTYHTGVNKKFSIYYDNKQSNIDPISDNSIKYALDEGFTMSKLCSRHPHWGEIYKSSFLSFGYIDALLVNFYSNNGDRGVLVLRSDPQRGEFSKNETQSISLLSPYLRTALNAHLQIYSHESADLGIFNILQSSDIAIFHIAKSGQLIQANNEGHGILNRSDGISLHNNHISIHDSISYFHFKKALLDICHTPSSTTRIIKIEREHEQFFIARILSFNSKISHNNEVILLVCDPFRSIRSKSTYLCELFDLTSREANVAIYLGNGYKIGDIAILNGVSINTVKSQRNSIYEKIGIKSQIQLVRLIYSLGILAETEIQTTNEDPLLLSSVRESLYSMLKVSH
ncbi:helix-turn-helix transcriptional regulator [Citrobacter portucalensis]|uniref:helix-turn-helix transcriptional regulator n=1 Tax=Citrobacter portucalensis TaxID=1639133 RepID=UPI00226B0954|nr:helix-turn-helix transcriptional regulator [Citrobacter portucalensis]MCX8985935.1 helix-turn-helix transcriptional regulator [Citrobacter portucalensis]